MARTRMLCRRWASLCPLSSAWPSLLWRASAPRPLRWCPRRPPGPRPRRDRCWGGGARLQPPPRLPVSWCCFSSLTQRPRPRPAGSGCSPHHYNTTGAPTFRLSLALVPLLLLEPARVIAVRVGLVIATAPGRRLLRIRHDAFSAPRQGNHALDRQRYVRPPGMLARPPTASLEQRLTPLRPHLSIDVPYQSLGNASSTLRLCTWEWNKDWNNIVVDPL